MKAKALAVIWNDDFLRIREKDEDTEPVAFLINGILYPSPATDRYNIRLQSYELTFAINAYGERLEEEPETEN